MNEEEKRINLIRELINEDPKLGSIEMLKDKEGQKILLRALMNVREPKEISNEFLEIQDSYLQEIFKEKKIMRISGLTPIDYIYIFKGDITTIECGAIVYAANSGMTGCYVPCHNCIDNAIHTYEGIELSKKEGAVGLITYMRTDSTRISDTAKQEAIQYIEGKYGKDYLSTGEVKQVKKKTLVPLIVFYWAYALLVSLYTKQTPMNESRGT